ncbi:Transmembrane protein 41A [Apophysomyces sp. BC1034]|nr:Transmembrane protein 41A [Apophysomyces sp. BC1015]KAG0179861.1 Transmembrane protein 41A [Apophysomyces sp. BC1021]KAG0190529.1 Transmembrane protein 41A [Apophysomyces sp. BC1034]
MARHNDIDSSSLDILDFSPLDPKHIPRNILDNDERVFQLDDAASDVPTWRQLFPRLALFVAIGLISLLFTMTLAHEVLDIGLPRTLAEVQETAVHLEEMARATWTGSFSVAGVFAVLYLWQQAFSVPGSVLLNLLAGYLYGIGLATVWTSWLTAAGATLAYGLAKLVGEPFMQVGWISRKAKVMMGQMNGRSKSGLFWWLLFVRLFPFTPYWFINMVSPLLGVPVSPFFWSTFIGVMPYNLVCAQAGDVLSDLTSTSDILSFSLMMKLLLVSFISLVPVLWGKTIQRYVRQFLRLPPAEDLDDDDVEKASVELDHDGYQRVSTHE